MFTLNRNLTLVFVLKKNDVLVLKKMSYLC